MTTSEVPLSGGNASASVVRAGDTVRKPWQPATPAVHAYMATVRAAGVDVPETHGQDERGRQVLEHVPGTLALERPLTALEDLARVGRLVRAIHDASPGLDDVASWPDPMLLPAPAPDLICHNDLAPWNLVVGARWVFIDWDGAGPSSRLWDLAYTAQSFTLAADEDVAVSARRLRALVDGYGADPELRAALPTAMADRTAAMHALLRDSHASGREPWGSMYAEGHGEHWSVAASYVRAHEGVWRTALLC